MSAASSAAISSTCRPAYDGQRALPAVLVFHGGGGAALSARTQTRMSEKGQAEGFIAVYPQGSGVLVGQAF